MVMAKMKNKKKNKKKKKATWPNAGMGLKVKCAQENCKWGNWGPWGMCSKTCDGGIRLRNRIISEQAKHGGDCEATSTDMEPCNVVACNIAYCKNLLGI